MTTISESTRPFLTVPLHSVRSLLEIKIMASWYTVNESKVSWAPIGTRVLKTGEEKPRFSRIGVRINMVDGSWWFYSFKHNSWTLHRVPVRKLDRLGRPAVEAGKPIFLPERKDRFANWTAVVKEFRNGREHLLTALQTAVESALAEEAEAEEA